MRHHRYWTYILTNYSRSVYYVGVTNNLERRLQEHRGGHVTFTGRYNVHLLMYAEETKYILNAIAREKQLKRWSRAEKLALVRTVNPLFEDLSAHM